MHREGVGLGDAKAAVFCCIEWDFVWSVSPTGGQCLRRRQADYAVLESDPFG